MARVYVNDLRYPIVLDKDGRLDLAPLGMEPASISIQNRKCLVGRDGITKRKWTSMVEDVFPRPPEGTEDLGTQSNPLQVTGSPLSAATLESVTVSTLKTLLQEHEEQYANMLRDALAPLATQQQLQQLTNKVDALQEAIRRLKASRCRDMRKPLPPLRNLNKGSTERWECNLRAAHWWRGSWGLDLCPRHKIPS